MKDTEAMGLVLHFLYEMRRGEFCPDNDVSPLFQETGRDEFYRVCKQLVDCGLVEWEAWEVPSERRVGYEWSANSIRITAAGINVVESGGIASPVPISFQQVVIQNSTGFQIGDHNSQQNIAVFIEKLIQGIEAADATPKEKAQAKGRLRALLEHPLVSAIVGAGVTALVDSLS